MERDFQLRPRLAKIILLARESDSDQIPQAVLVEPFDIALMPDQFCITVRVIGLVVAIRPSLP
jgi:hypothetical protein